MNRNYQFGNASIANIATTEPIMQKLCHEALRIANRRQLYCPDFGISAGLRTAEEQHDLYQSGRTKAGKILTHCDGYQIQSVHQTGLAVDFYAYVDGKINYDICNLALIATCFFEAASNLEINVDWGGSFRSISDLPHFEIIL